MKTNNNQIDKLNGKQNESNDFLGRLNFRFALFESKRGQLSFDEEDEIKTGAVKKMETKKIIPRKYNSLTLYKFYVNGRYRYCSNETGIANLCKHFKIVSTKVFIACSNHMLISHHFDIILRILLPNLISKSFIPRVKMKFYSSIKRQRKKRKDETQERDYQIFKRKTTTKISGKQYQLAATIHLSKIQFYNTFKSH